MADIVFTCGPSASAFTRNTTGGHVRHCGAWPEVVETLEFGLIGALVQASCEGRFHQTAGQIAGVVATVLPDCR
jgi:hypothetical protein